MIRLLASAIAMLVLMASANAADTRTVSFKAATVGGQPIGLLGRLTRPDGAGPFPAIILMHGCSGLRQWGDLWSERFARWGYVVLRPDSFGTRGIRDCAKGNATIGVRANDAEAARRYLAGLQSVDKERIALMGMAHGGTAALLAVGGTAKDVERADIETFGAVIAMYPRCYQARSEAILAPILILIGESDHLSPASACSTQATRGGSGHPLDVVVYPRATHAFDWKGIDMAYFGQRIRYDREATADAIERIRAFLKLYLRQR